MLSVNGVGCTSGASARSDISAKASAAAIEFGAWHTPTGVEQSAIVAPQAPTLRRSMARESLPPQDAKSIIREQQFRRLLILSAAVGLIVSVAAWAFLTLVPWIQDLLFIDLPGFVGFSDRPWWWPIPVLAVAGVLASLAILKLPGRGGGIPADGLSAGIPDPVTLPGILLAALATLGFGLVLGPSSPVIALGTGLGALIVRSAAPDTPEGAQKVIAAAGGFAALAMVFSNPMVAAIVLIEAAGIGGSMAPVLVLPGLLAAGIGSLVYFGMNNFTGLSTSAYALQPLELPTLETLSLADFAWAVPIAAACAALGIIVVALGKRIHRLVSSRYVLWLPIAGVVVAALAVVYAAITGESELAILFSGSKALSPVVEQGDTIALATLAWLLLLKATAWTLSMGSFRGGPVFPAIFIGTVAGVLASHLPGFSMSSAVPVAVAATVVAVMRLPLSASLIALLLAGSAGLQITPLIIAAAVVGYVTGEVLRGRFLENTEIPATQTGAQA
jgi:H+/Cl- antiporter ClcA